MRLLHCAIACLTACERAHDATKTIELPLPKVTATLVDPGAEPRALLRDQTPVGTRRRTRSTMSGELRKPRHATIDPRTTLAEGELVDIDANGIRHFKERILDTSPEHAGGEVETWSDPRGATIRARITLGGSDELTDSSGQPERMTIAPEEPVGVGARWHEDIVYKGQAASLDVRLVARDGTHVREEIRYHVTVAKPDPGTRDGTATSDFDLVDPGATRHQTETITLDRPEGRAEGVLSYDDVVQVP